MINTMDFILKIIFLILTIIWIGKIMILRTDKQIVINPVLIGISSLLVIIPDNGMLFMSSNVTQIIKICLFTIYCLIIVFGIYSTSRNYDNL